MDYGFMNMRIYVGGAYPDGAINEINFKSLKQSLSENGFSVTANYQNADIYISNDFVARDRDKLNGFSKRNRILLVCEPRIVLPSNYKKRIRELLGLEAKR
jgi:hypothetical protein